MFRKTLIAFGKNKSILSAASRQYFAANAGAEQGKEVSKKVEQAKTKKDVQFYQNGQLVNRTSLILKKHEDIEAYVVKTIRNYFRTTNKKALGLESQLSDHGLDSLDSIEISMQIEEELGYVISAETLPVLQKVKHFVNYISQVEQFKQEYKIDPLS